MAILSEIYVGNGYGGVVALGDIPLRGAHKLLEFTGCERGENAVGSYTNPR